MSFFDKMKKGVADAGSKAKTLVEVNKLRLNIQSLEAEMDERYKKIGQLLYAATSDEIDSEPTLDQEAKEALLQFCKEIRSRQAEVAELNKRILELNNLKPCAKCGRVNQAHIKFCPDCGHEFTQVVTIDIVAAQPGVQQSNSACASQEAATVCAKCREPLSQTDRFCGSCGALR